MKKTLLALLFLLFAFAFASCGEEKKSCYRLACEYDEALQTLSGELSFTYYNDTGSSMEVLWFELYPNAYREGAKYSPVSSIHRSAYYAGESFGEIVVSSVSNCRTFEIGGEDRNLLFVTLEKPLKAGGSTSLGISFQTKLAKVEHRLGVAKNAVNLCNFYPVLCGYDEGKGFYECVYYSDGDPFYSETADYELSLTLPEKFSLAASGRVEKTSGGSGKSTYSVSAKNRRDIACVFSESFEKVECEKNNVQVNYYYKEDTNAEETLFVASQALEFFSETFAPYAWDTFTVAETGFCFGGMEYPSLVLISDRLEGDARLQTLVHETAHQWWYAMVGNNASEYAWMDEGLAEYSTALFFEQYPEYGIKKESLEKAARESFHSFCGIYRQIFGEADVTMNRPLSSFVSEYEYVNIAYEKGSLLFFCLEDGIGKPSVISSLKKYAEKYRFAVAEPNGLIECFPRAARGVINSFLDGSAVI